MAQSGAGDVAGGKVMRKGAGNSSGEWGTMRATRKTVDRINAECDRTGWMVSEILELVIEAMDFSRLPTRDEMFSVARARATKRGDDGGTP